MTLILSMYLNRQHMFRGQRKPTYSTLTKISQGKNVEAY